MQQLLLNSQKLAVTEIGFGFRQAAEAALRGLPVYFALTGPAAPSVALEVDGKFFRYDLTRDQVEKLQSLIERAHEVNDSLAALDKTLYTCLTEAGLTIRVEALTKGGLLLSDAIGQPGQHTGMVLNHKGQEVVINPGTYKVKTKGGKSEILFESADTLHQLTAVFGDLTSESLALNIRFAAVRE